MGTYCRPLQAINIQVACDVAKRTSTQDESAKFQEAYPRLLPKSSCFKTWSRFHPVDDTQMIILQVALKIWVS